MPADKDPLYLEAVSVYKSFLTEVDKLEVIGGAKTLPPVFDRYLVGEYKSAVEDAYAEQLLSGRHMLQGHTGVLTATIPNPGVSVPGSQMSIQACVDATGSDIVNKSGEVVGKGVLTHYTLFFARQIDGQFKIMDGYSEVVAECPIH